MVNARELDSSRPEQMTGKVAVLRALADYTAAYKTRNRIVHSVWYGFGKAQAQAPSKYRSPGSPFVPTSTMDILDAHLAINKCVLDLAIAMGQFLSDDEWNSKLPGATLASQSYIEFLKKHNSNSE